MDILYLLWYYCIKDILTMFYGKTGVKMKLTKEEAYRLLIDGLSDPGSIGYVPHSRYVGDLAGMIAEGMGLDAEYATVLGYIHDIGRKIDPGNHIYAGYKYLKENGYGEYAFICLTHSFLNNDIECICGRLLPEDSEGYEEVRSFIKNRQYTDYDRIIQTCDLLCLHTGGTTLEARIDDIESRKGTHHKSKYHRDAAIKQKAYLEEKLGHPIYDFYDKLHTEEKKMRKILVVVDMQKDFVDGALGSKEAQAIIPAAVKKIKEFEGDIFVTFDTHFENYAETAEGRKLPVPHCIKDSEGWQLDSSIAKALEGKEYIHVEKNTFGSVFLPAVIEKTAGEEEFCVELIGLCTDICVVSNALLLKASFPEAPISVDSSCCAGVTPAKHEAALETMRSCQIDII